MDKAKILGKTDELTAAVRRYVGAMPEPLMREALAYILTSSIAGKVFPPKNRDRMVMSAVDNIQDAIDAGMRQAAEAQNGKS